MPKTRTLLSIYEPEQLKRIRTVVQHIQQESGLALEPMALAISQLLPNGERIGKDTIHALAKIGLDDAVKGTASLLWLPLLSKVSKIYTEEDLKAIARGCEPLSAKARERQGLPPLDNKEIINSKNMSKILYLLNMTRASTALIEQEIYVMIKLLSSEERQKLENLIAGNGENGEVRHLARIGLAQNLASSVIDTMLPFVEEGISSEEAYNRQKVHHLDFV